LRAVHADRGDHGHSGGIASSGAPIRGLRSYHRWRNAGHRRQVARRVRRVANGLRHHGTPAGDRLAILMLKGNRYAELYYAAARIGALVVPSTIGLQLSELAAILEDIGASVACR